MITHKELMKNWNGAKAFLINENSISGSWSFPSTEEDFKDENFAFYSFDNGIDSLMVEFSKEDLDMATILTNGSAFFPNYNNLIITPLFPRL